LEYTHVSEVRNTSIIWAIIHRPDDEAVRTSETSVYFNETTRLYIPQGCHLQN
jgi:hypothetical protein